MFDNVTAHKIKFSIKDFFGKCDQIRRKLRIWSYLLKKSLMENFIFCAACSRYASDFALDFLNILASCPRANLIAKKIKFYNLLFFDLLFLPSNPGPIKTLTTSTFP